MKNSDIIYNTDQLCGFEKTLQKVVDKCISGMYNTKTVCESGWWKPQKDLKKEKIRVDKSQISGIINELSRKG